MAPSSAPAGMRRGQEGNPAAEALGRSQGGFSTKVHLRAEGGGKPMTLALTPGQRNEATVFACLLEQGAARRPGCGRPGLRPHGVVGNKGSAGRVRRASYRRRGIRCSIARLRTEHHGRFDRAAYRQHNRVERLIGRCTQLRSLATRLDKRARSWRPLWLIAFINGDWKKLPNELTGTVVHCFSAPSTHLLGHHFASDQSCLGAPPAYEGPLAPGTGLVAWIDARQTDGEGLIHSQSAFPV
jgi:hypothetical protein